MERAPLRSIDGNVIRRTELTPYKRGIIVGKLTSRAGASALERELIVPRTIIQSVGLAANWQHNGISKARTGRPSIITDRDCRYIIHYAREKPKITYKKLSLAANIMFSRSTMYRVLKDYRLTNWIAKKRPFLCQSNVDAQKAWAEIHKNWVREDWEKVIWTDECSIKRGSGKQRE